MDGCTTSSLNLVVVVPPQMTPSDGPGRPNEVTKQVSSPKFTILFWQIVESKYVR